MSDEEEIVTLLWNRLVVMIYFLIKLLRDTTVNNIVDALTKIESMVSKKQLCVKYVDDDEDNCIISALLNLLSGMKEFNQIIDSDSKLTPSCVETAATIILNRDVTDEVQPSMDVKDFEKEEQSSLSGFEKDLEDILAYGS